MALLVGFASVSIANYLEARREASLGGQLAGESVSRQEWERTLRSASASIFKVEVKSCSGVQLGTGTGFLTKHGVVTNRHVVEKGGSLTLRNDKGVTLDVQSWIVDKDKDLALVQVGESKIKELELSSQNPTPGQLVGTVGHPLGGGLEIRNGRVFSLVDGEEFDVSGMLVAMTAEALPGDSGGPVISPQGQVLGVTTYLLYKKDLSVALPVRDLEEFVENSHLATKTRPCVPTG